MAAVVEEAVGGRFLTKSLARVFQAVRIEVNDELGSLRDGLERSIEFLVPGGRVVVIAYHSLEDRIVKEFMKRESATSSPSGHKYLPDTPLVPRLKVLTKKPLKTGPQEQEKNNRARSALLRAAERLASGYIA